MQHYPPQHPYYPPPIPVQQQQKKPRPDYKFIAIALIVFALALQLGGIAITVLDASPLGPLAWLAGLALTAAALIPICLLRAAR